MNSQILTMVITGGSFLPRGALVLSAKLRLTRIIYDGYATIYDMLPEVQEISTESGDENNRIYYIGSTKISTFMGVTFESRNRLVIGNQQLLFRKQNTTWAGAMLLINHQISGEL